jgi:diacylglycerol kinase family enzyme
VSRKHGALGELGKYVLHLGKTKTHAYHAQGKKIILEAEPPQTVWLDGEYYKNTPVAIQVHQGAVKIVVP